MKKDNIIKVDINQFIEGKVAEKISILESIIESQNKTISENLIVKDNQFKELNRYITEIETKNKELEKKLEIFSVIEAGFANIKVQFDQVDKTPKTEYDCEKSKQQNQFYFIAKIMYAMYYGKETKVIKDIQYLDGSLATNLAITFYEQKENVINLLRLLMPEAIDIITKIKDFKMPFDYSKEKLIPLMNIKSHTNGYYTGVNRYWTESGAGISNIPYDLLLANPLVLEDDVFDELIKSINKNSDGHYLFLVAKVNKNITDEQVQRLGYEYLKLNKTIQVWNKSKEFIRLNLHKFNDEILDKLIKSVTTNIYDDLFWGRFPIKFQYKYLNTKSMGEIVKLISDNKSWDIEKTNHFFSKYFVIKK